MTLRNVILFIGSGTFLVQLFCCGDLTIPNLERCFHCFLDKVKLRHSLGRPSRSDFVQSGFVEVQMEECIFCKIASGEIQGLRIYENNETLAFMDIAKDVDGHILVIPKKHCKNILDCDSETLSAVMNTVKRVSNHLTENCGYDGINLLNASDESAGQSVNHFHIHIIPRKSNDGIDAWPKFEGAKEELQTVFDKVKM